jgi:Sulfotransferase family
VLVERSPPNLVMTRSSRAPFPDARFVMVVRHPAIVSLSTRKWARLRSLSALLDHWFAAHRTFEEDAAFLHHLLVVKNEHLVADPEGTLAEIAAFLELDGAIPAGGIDTRRSATYERQWAELAGGGDGAASGSAPCATATRRPPTTSATASWTCTAPTVPGRLRPPVLTRGGQLRLRNRRSWPGASSAAKASSPSPSGATASRSVGERRVRARPPGRRPGPAGSGRRGTTTGTGGGR